jgi:hypothetical protein
MGFDRMALIGRKNRAGISHPQCERGGDIRVRRLRSVIQAMGGELRVQARMRDRDRATWKEYSHPKKELVDTRRSAFFYGLAFLLFLCRDLDCRYCSASDRGTGFHDSDLLNVGGLRSLVSSPLRPAVSRNLSVPSALAREAGVHLGDSRGRRWT